MARSRGDNAKDRADWQRLNKLATKHGWDEEPEDPKHRVYFVEGTREQLHDMGFHLADIGAQDATEDDDEPEPDKDEPEKDEPEPEPEKDEPEPEPEPEPKPRSRSRYFGGR